MKRIKKLKLSVFIFLILFFLPGGLHSAAQSTGNIYLYGEHHGVEKILKKEIEIWGEYYNKHGLRHLFIEHSYYTAEFLNIWMKSEDDDILDRIYEDWQGTQSHSPVVKDFYKEIKIRFPETIFHGTDVGHQYNTIGKRYLEYLSQQNMKDSEQYSYAKEIIEQGKSFYAERDHAYRENMMVVNFVREFNNLNNESIMGIYGGAHTGINSMDNSNSVPCMANQLYKIYADQLFTKNLHNQPEERDSLRTDNIQINGTDYEAVYFGKQSLKGFKDFEYRKFWRLEDAYNDFKETKKTGDVLPYNNYPMKIEKGQVFVIDIMKTDSTLFRKYYRSDGNSWKNRPTTEEFVVDK